MCLPTGGNNVVFDEGDFTPATLMQGDGQTDADITEFTAGTVYRMILQLTTNCDLDATEEATLIIIVDKGRTQERFLEIGGAPYEGQDLM
jgi:lipoate-protein ligase A